MLAAHGVNIGGIALILALEDSDTELVSDNAHLRAENARLRSENSSG